MENGAVARVLGIRRVGGTEAIFWEDILDVHHIPEIQKNLISGDRKSVV